jgi:hypothetical protein
VAWEPRHPLTAAEQHVDFPAHNDHIVLRRAAIEKNAAGAARRLAVAIAEYGLPTNGGVQTLTDRLEQSLQATARFGYTEARREIRALRDTGRALAYAVPDAGDHADQAQQGLEGITPLIRRRARETAQKVADAARGAAAKERDDIFKAAAAVTAARRVLHNHVLELVGETLNMGRTAGALSFAQPPTFAMRSEQLDKATCDSCAYEHGAIYQTGSDEYYQHLPPSYCYGGGRCRGLMIYADTELQVRLPEAA